MGTDAREPADSPPLKSLVVVFSYHHRNTEKIANAMARVLGAAVKTPGQVTPEEIREYDLVGFGSGIYGATFDPSLIDLAGRLPQVAGNNVFLFSTFGAPAAIADRAFVTKNHAQIRETLEAKGYAIAGEFGCPGWNTNSFLNLFGGLNKGRPDAGDLAHAEAFAREMLETARGDRTPPETCR